LKSSHMPANALPETMHSAAVSAASLAFIFILVLLFRGRSPRDPG
jgi:hypothetical protein